ncbi:MAG: hypothetical protein PHW77_04335 [Eubacteriales bacterium]|nr:hypothetical protein [Eubacteriales bacterium]
MRCVEIDKVQFWQTKASILILPFAAAVCTGAFFGGNFKKETLRQTDFWWWFSAMILVLICRRYYKTASKIGIVCGVAVCAVVGLLVTENFIGIRFIEWSIYAGVITAMFLLSFLPVLEFFEYKPIPVLIAQYLIFSLIALCFVMIAAYLITAVIYITLLMIYN